MRFTLLKNEACESERLHSVLLTAFLGDAVGGGDHAYVGLDELGYRKYKPSLW
jgi:hypothetical protein